MVEAEDDKEKDDTVKSQLSTSIYTIGIKYSGIAIPTLLSYRNHAVPGCGGDQVRLDLSGVRFVARRSSAEYACVDDG